MNKFSSFLKATLLDPFIRSYRRFTDTIVLSIILAILNIIDLETGGALLFLRDMLPYLWLALPLLVFKTILVERLHLQPYWRYIFLGIALVIVAAYYVLNRYVFVAMSSMYVFRMVTAWIIVLILPVLARHFPKHEGFAQYLIYLLTKFFVTFFYAAVLYGGLLGILTSIEALFGLHFSNYLYVDLFIVIVGFVAIPVFLGYFPTNDYVTSDADFHIVWKTVFVFIIVPLIMIFSAILIIYIATSFINPNYFDSVFLIATLISVFVTQAMLFLLNDYQKNYPHISFFTRVWPYVALTLVAGYCYELINSLVNNGFTLANSIYFYLGVAILALSIVRVIKKPLKVGHGQIIGVTAILSCITMAFVPFINILNLATYSLNNRFERLLDGYNMLENGEIVANPELSNEGKRDISRFVLSSLVDIGYERVRCLPDDFTIDDFLDVFGFEIYYGEGNIRTLSYSGLDDEIDFSLIDIAGYTDFLYINNLSSESSSFGRYSHVFNEDTNIWSLTKDEVDYVDIDLATVLSVLHARFGVDDNYDLDRYTDLKYTSIDETYDMYINSIWGEYLQANDTYRVGSISFYIGVK